MLHQNAVTASSLGVLKRISAFNELQSFGLGGGTNLALRIGHRLSVDLDFFTNQPFETSLLFEKNQTILFNIDDIKVDFVLYPFRWLYPFDIFNEIRLLSVPDIIPMKL